jgi:uncharacterized RDD family membrane protein YckC
MQTTPSLPVAANSKRVVSFIIDDFIVNMLLLAIFYSPLSALMQEVATKSPQEAYMAVNAFIIANLPIVLAVKVLYHTVLIWQSGMTVGKYTMKIKAVDIQSGEKLSFLQAFWRASVRILSEAFFYIGFLFAFFSPLHQTLHDKLSNCVVIDENVH